MFVFLFGTETNTAKPMFWLMQGIVHLGIGIRLVKEFIWWGR